jgi:hypothetical protein
VQIAGSFGDALQLGHTAKHLQAKIQHGRESAK